MLLMLGKTRKIFLFVVCGFLFMPALASAHQPRITETRPTEIPSPEVSKAYYATLPGVPDVYTIQASTPFNLYVNILVPDIAGQKTDVTATVFKDGNQLAVLDGPSFAWKKFYEPFGADTYLMGPEYRARVEAGKYEIRVSSPDNDSKYSLAVGEIEAFDMKEGLNALKVIPELKKSFFNASPISFILSPFGWGLIVSMYILAAIVGLAYRFILKSIAKGSVRGVQKNIGKPDRLLRLAIGLALLLWAILTSWSPILIFFSGFALFESLFSWCAFYQLMGKNTCPI